MLKLDGQNIDNGRSFDSSDIHPLLCKGNQRPQSGFHSLKPLTGVRGPIVSRHQQEGAQALKKCGYRGSPDLLDGLAQPVGQRIE
jgi:hypothetical protein